MRDVARTRYAERTVGANSDVAALGIDPKEETVVLAVFRVFGRHNEPPKRLQLSF